MGVSDHIEPTSGPPQQQARHIFFKIANPLGVFAKKLVTFIRAA
jgi:hypothetical protein